MDKPRRLEDKVEDILEVKVLLFEKSIEQLETNLSLQIAQNREVVSMKIDEVKKEVIEVNKHLIKLNGTARTNSDKIIVLQEGQKNNDSKFRKIWWVVTAIISAGLFSAGIALVNHFTG